MLAAFAVLQGVRQWIHVFPSLSGSLEPVTQVLGAVALVSLYGFALGANSVRLRNGLIAVAAVVVSATAAGAFLADAAYLSPIAMMAACMPAAILSGWELWHEPTFRSSTRASRLTAGLTASGFLAYAVLLLWSPQQNPLFPAYFSNEAFQAILGISVMDLRTVLLICVAGGFLVLLNQIEAEKRVQAEDRTTRSRAELEASEARLRTMLQSEPACVKLIGPDCTLRDMNPAGMRMVGVQDLDSILGKSVLPLILPEYHDAYREAVRRVFAGETTFVQYEIVSRDGTHRWLEQNAAPIFDPANPSHVHEMIAVTRDVTSRIIVEKSERIAKERLELAQRIAKVGSWEWDLASNELSWSDECYRILGWNPKDGKPTLERFMASCHPEDRTSLQEIIQRGILSSAASEYEHRILWPDGTVRIIHQLFHVERDRDGKPVHMMGTTQDVTDFRTIEAELRQSQTTLSGILTISPEAIIVTDADGHISLFSAGAETIFGCKAADVIGRHIAMLIPERYRESHQQHFASLSRAGTVSRKMGTRSTITAQRRNGEEFPAEASLSKLDSPNGPVFTTIMRDMTHEQASRLELLESKLRAEEANIAKSRFLANMSHELRTPLNAIIGFSDMLQSGIVANEDKRREYAADINNSGRHLLKVINDILDISRIEAGKMSLVEETIDITDVVESCLRMVAPHATAAQVGISAHVQPSLPGLLADRRLVLQILLNLLSNAVKFSHTGGVVDIHAEIDPASRLVIEVRDHGIGMSAEDVARIGEPFLQVDGRLERKFEGTGLGLVIAKRMMELHGGEVLVRSALGQGTMMSIVFPASRTTKPAASASRITA
jgi:PAS domain S-box-containing protein